MFDPGKVNKLVVSNDRLRMRYLKTLEISKFISTYSGKFDIPNVNNKPYWNRKFKERTTLDEQGAITRNKIKLVANNIGKNDKKILDVGVGLGYIEQQLSKSGNDYKFYGVDISSDSISYMNNNFKGIFLEADLLNLNRLFKPNFFDVILAIEVLEHISPSKLFKLYADIHKLLKTNGKFIITVPINEGLEKMRTNPSAHVRDYSSSIIKKELELNGFTIENTFELFAFSKFYPMKQLLSKIFKNRWKPNSLIVIAAKAGNKSKKKAATYHNHRF